MRPVFLLLLIGCTGWGNSDPAMCCDDRWCLLLEADGGARVIGAP